MASLAFLFAPINPIPDETDVAWYTDVSQWSHAVNRQWDGLRNQLPAADQARVPEWLPSALPNSAIRVGAGSSAREVQKLAWEWTRARFDAFRANNFEGPLPCITAHAASESLGQPVQFGLSYLKEYRGNTMRLIPPAKLGKGGRVGLLGNASSAWEFDLFSHGGPERRAVRVHATACGGDYVTLGTWGNTLWVERVCSDAPGRAPHIDTRWAVHVVPVADRQAGSLQRLRAMFEGARIQLDFGAIERELLAPRISVTAFFAAFGVQGAREIQPPDAEQTWQQFDEACMALLAGQPAPAAALKAVNAVLSEQGGKLPAKPATPGKGSTADKVTRAYYTLRDSLPAPTTGVWADRAAVANTVWVLDDSPAGMNMTFGEGAKGLGPAAAVSRMLAHAQPRGCSGDAMAWAMLSVQCEDANWHGFVEPLARLAETRTHAGLAVIVAPVSERAALDGAFGLLVDDRSRDVPTGDWTGEVFVDSPALVKTDARATLAAWMRKRRTRGAVAYVAAEGAVSITYFMDGKEVADAGAAGLPVADVEAMRRAREDFDVRALPIALGAGDLLAPGDMSPNCPLPEEGHSNEERQAVDLLLSALPAPEPIAGWDELGGRIGHEVRLSRFEDDEYVADPGRLTLRMQVPGVTPAGLCLLLGDLKATGLANYGDVWRKGKDTLHADMGSDYLTGLLQLVLGDTPSGTQLGLTLPRGGHAHYVLAP